MRAAASGQRGFDPDACDGVRLYLRGGHNARLDCVCDAAANAVLWWGFKIVIEGFRLDQLRLWVLAAQQVAQSGHFARCSHFRRDLWLRRGLCVVIRAVGADDGRHFTAPSSSGSGGHHGRGSCHRAAAHGSYSTGFHIDGRLYRAAGAGVGPVGHAGGNSAAGSGSSLRGTGGPLPHDAQDHVIQHDSAHQHKLGARAQFGAGKAKGKAHGGHGQSAKQQRQQFYANHRAQRQDRQRHAKHGVAKQTAHAKVGGPSVTARQGCSIKRSNGDHDRNIDDAANGAIRAAVQHKACTPCNQDQRQGIDPLAHDHHQRGGGCCTENAKPVLHGRIAGGNPRRIGGRIAEADHRGQQADDDQTNAKQFLATAFQNGLGFAVQKRVAVPCLIGCHFAVPHW